MDTQILQLAPLPSSRIKSEEMREEAEILEFCDPSDAIVIEQHYIDILKPEYNILKIAGSSLGYTHTEETLAKFKARSLTPEQKTNDWPLPSSLQT